MYEELKRIFEEANQSFLQEEKDLFDMEVSERTLCGVLMIHITEQIKGTDFKEYKVDVEYNRNKGGKGKSIKTIKNNRDCVLNINCDLILHSRGSKVEQDNLIAIEMKKTTRPQSEKEKDKERLQALTSYNNVWALKGTLPEHVCGYVLGVYYEIDYRKKNVLIEYYRGGKYVDSYTLNY